MTTSDRQVRKLMQEMTKHGAIEKAAMRAGMDPKTARKYVALGELPSALVTARDWLTRDNPFAEHWEEVCGLLKSMPELEAKTLFEMLQDKYPGCYEEGQLRTLQRHIKRWRAAYGPDKLVMFSQQHRPGEAAQTDFTSANELGVTIAGESFRHMLCVVVLPFSNWMWATICFSESIASLRRGIQRALFQLGRVPRFHQTDNSTAATHRLAAPCEDALTDTALAADDSEALGKPTRKRPFNEDYLALMRHLGMTPRTTEVGEKEQNGDVEAGNGALKRKLEQALLLRGNRDFESVASWQEFIDQAIRKANGRRSKRLAQELGVMRELNVAKLAEFEEQRLPVSECSTIRVKGVAYSVPSRLMREEVKVYVYEDKLEVYYADRLQLTCERIRGKHARRIDYRHVIWSLVRKPGAFERYVYREEMFPSVVFRRAYDAIQLVHPGTKGNLEYLRILHQAASTGEDDIEAALALLLSERKPITVDNVKALVSTPAPPAVPVLLKESVDLTVYDLLLPEVGT